jgi:hypothetical protein
VISCIGKAIINNRNHLSPEITWAEFSYHQETLCMQAYYQECACIWALYHKESLGWVLYKLTIRNHLGWFLSGSSHNELNTRSLQGSQAYHRESLGLSYLCTRLTTRDCPCIQAYHQGLPKLTIGNIPCMSLPPRIIWAECICVQAYHQELPIYMSLPPGISHVWAYHHESFGLCAFVYKLTTRNCLSLPPGISHV